MRSSIPRRLAAGLLLAPLLPVARAVAPSARMADRVFTTSDGVGLHFIEAGPHPAPALVFVPGWTMPAWIWRSQLDAFSRTHRVVALDPRGQGESEIAPGGYDHLRRGRDIGELLALLGPRPVVLVGWSLGVLDSLAYVRQAGDERLAGLVLVDNSVGEDPPPQPVHRPPRRGPPVEREVYMRAFVRSMFRRSPGEGYLARLTEAALRTPKAAADALLSYPVPRAYWRDAVYSVHKPVLYAVTPRFAAQAANLQSRHPAAETEVFEGAGHALFVDEATRFNALLGGFLRRRVWRA